ncbi:MAG: tRNA 2-thiouridine(34) synthase MnmA [Oscillospiraceae bacterium]|jgi:tRNA-specific 2-thiouridylase
MEKIVLGLSGGVDSAVSARLLQEAGYEVCGLYMDIAGEEARADARSVAEQLGVSLVVADVAAAQERFVRRPFVEAYLRGETPNPCILCNPAVKFKTLLDYADEIGAKYVSTGHYVRAENGQILKGRPENDQSYMLCRLKREQAARLIMPLGPYNKEEVRALAERFALPVAHKAASMEICFIPDKDYVGWLSTRGERLPPPGNFIFRGEIVGQHEGIHRWTVGQRLPGLFNERKLYVSRIVPERNEIELALWEELFKTELSARDMNWLIDPPETPLRASVKVRHTKWENPPCTVYPEGDRVRVVCDEPVRAPAAGQSAVFYDGERLIGGGIIL